MAKNDKALGIIRKIANMAKAEKISLDEYCNSNDFNHPYDSVEALYFLIARIEDYEKEANQ